MVTGQARARIRRFIRAQEREQYAHLGRAILQKVFREAGYEFSDKALEGVLRSFKVNTPDDLCAQVGSGHISGRDVVETVYPGEKAKRLGPEKVVPIGRARGRSGQGQDDGGSHRRPHPRYGRAFRGLLPSAARRPHRRHHHDGARRHHPHHRLPRIGRASASSRNGGSTLPGNDDSEEAEIHVGRVNMTLMNEPGSLGTVSNIVAKNDGNISNLKIVNRTTDFFEILIDIEVKDLKHLTNIIAALRASPVINEVERARG